jgi:class 3 adenylate cyclase
MTAIRRLAAILAADVAGYSRLMGADEEGTLERLKALRCELVDPKIAEHRGPHRQDHRRRPAARVRQRRRCGALRGRSAAGDG